MVKLADSKGKSGEGYVRIFGNDEMGILLSKTQSTMIRSGFELERMLEDILPKEMITTLDELQNLDSSDVKPLPIQVVFKPSRPDPDNVKKSIQADILIIDNAERYFWLVEIKEGYVFDTKKSDGELSSLKSITSWLAQEFPYKTQYFLCSFNQEDKDAIVNGTKKRFSIDHVLTGRELCEKIGINYDDLRQKRQRDQKENLNYFLRQLLAIPIIQDQIVTILAEIENGKH